MKCKQMSPLVRIRYVAVTPNESPSSDKKTDVPALRESSQTSAVSSFTVAPNQSAVAARKDALEVVVGSVAHRVFLEVFTVLLPVLVRRSVHLLGSVAVDDSISGGVLSNPGAVSCLVPTLDESDGSRESGPDEECSERGHDTCP